MNSNRLGRDDVWVLQPGANQLERVRLPGPDVGVILPFWSPDGRQIAVTRYLPDGTTSLWLAAVDGSSAEEIVKAKRNLQGAPFSPDGRSVLYAYSKVGYRQLFILDLANRRERQLTFSPSDKYDPDWSPDGRWVIFSSNSAASTYQVSKIPSSGGQEKVVASEYERLRHLFYSPDGQWIYVQRSHRNIYRMPASGGPLQQVTNFPDAGLFLEEPTISRDGHWLAYCRSNAGSSLWLLKIGSSQTRIQ